MNLKLFTPSRALLRQLARFLVTTVAGLCIDLGVYAVLVAAGVPAVFANLISASLSVVVVYFLSKGFVFGGRHSIGVFIGFAGWYAVSIIAFSLFVQAGVDVWGLPPMIAKVASLPFSFVANFLAVRGVFLLADRRAALRSPQDARNPDPS